MAKIHLADVEVDVEKVDVIRGRVDVNSDLIEDIVNDLVHKYTQELDDYMKFVKDIVTNVHYPPNNLELDDVVMNIPVLLYFTGSYQETLGVKEDMVKVIRQEIYSQAYEVATGTVGDKTAFAELSSQNETLAVIAYQRAYKKVKLRMEAAQETLTSVKKVMSRRMAEFEVTRTDPGTTGGKRGPING